MSSFFLWAASVLFLPGVVVGVGAAPPVQEIQLGDALRPAGAKGRQRVELETDTARVQAGRPDWIELRFRVDPGLHINSHTPQDELLIPTTLQLASPSVRLLGEEYPPGVPLRLDVGGGETLSTYQGEFRVRLQVVAKAPSTLEGMLHYQACDARACYPPRDLPVRVALVPR